MTTETADVVIVGVGAVGGIIAAELGKAGMKVIGLERGPRLTTQDFVELLKMPTCVGELRRFILDQLGNRYSRRFDTHWDFVRYAQEQRLDLDFTTPPQRPDAKLPPLLGE